MSKLFKKLRSYQHIHFQHAYVDACATGEVGAVLSQYVYVKEHVVA